METLNIDPERYALEWVSSAEAPRFAQVVTDFINKIKAMGPNPLRPLKSGAAMAAG